MEEPSRERSSNYNPASVASALIRTANSWDILGLTNSKTLGKQGPEICVVTRPHSD
jgi:hypothetical protein